jgi:hypothetical protein
VLVLSYAIASELFSFFFFSSLLYNYIQINLYTGVTKGPSAIEEIEVERLVEWLSAVPLAELPVSSPSSSSSFVLLLHVINHVAIIRDALTRETRLLGPCYSMEWGLLKLKQIFCSNSVLLRFTSYEEARQMCEATSAIAAWCLISSPRWQAKAEILSAYDAVRLHRLYGSLLSRLGASQENDLPQKGSVIVQVLVFAPY